MINGGAVACLLPVVSNRVKKDNPARIETTTCLQELNSQSASILNDAVRAQATKARNLERAIDGDRTLVRSLRTCRPSRVTAGYSPRPRPGSGGRRRSWRC